jgi:hypothetical protein
MHIGHKLNRIVCNCCTNDTFYYLYSNCLQCTKCDTIKIVSSDETQHIHHTNIDSDKLQIIEQSIDKALENETQETLIEWIESQR